MTVDIKRDVFRLAQVFTISRGSRTAAEVLTVTMMLHMLRVYFTASYKNPREVNWLTGIVLLLIIVNLLLTGTVLKWDQEAYEALDHFLWTVERMGIL